MATITCRDCGEIRKNCPKNTVLCRECRTLQQIQYAIHQQLRKADNSKDKTKKTSDFAYKKVCGMCEKDFTPYRRDDFACPNCYADLNFQFELKEDCPCCRKTAEQRYNESGSWPVRLFDDIPICNFCFGSPNIKYRKAILRFLADRQKNRAKENNHVKPAQPAADPTS